MYGLARPTVGVKRPVRIIQTAQSSGSTLTLSQAPNVGSVLLVGGGSIQATDFTVSGGGATWARCGRGVLASGAQIEGQLWVGIVGTSPSTSISVPMANSMNAAAVEISGVSGLVRAGAYTQSGASPISPDTAINTAVATVAVLWFTSRGSIPGAVAGWQQVISFQSSNVIFGMAIKLVAPYESVKPVVSGFGSSNSALAVGLVA